MLALTCAPFARAAVSTANRSFSANAGGVAVTATAGQHKEFIAVGTSLGEHLNADPALRMRRVRQQALVAADLSLEGTLEGWASRLPGGLTEQSGQRAAEQFFLPAPSPRKVGRVAEDEACVAIPATNRQRNDIGQSFELRSRCCRNQGLHGGLLARAIADITAVAPNGLREDNKSG